VVVVVGGAVVVVVGGAVVVVVVAAGGAVVVVELVATGALVVVVVGSRSPLVQDAGWGRWETQPAVLDVWLEAPALSVLTTPRAPATSTEVSRAYSTRVAPRDPRRPRHPP
jgi:hypothetical protein